MYIFITQCHGCDRYVGIDGRLQERCVEGVQMCAVGRRALRKNRKPVPRRQTLRHVAPDGVRVPPAATLQENGFVMAGQRADDRPVHDVILGDKGNGCQRIDREDVDPADVVGGDQADLFRQRALDLQCKTEIAQELARPTRAYFTAARYREERKGSQNPEQATKQMQNNPRTAHEAQVRRHRGGHHAA